MEFANGTAQPSYEDTGQGTAVVFLLENSQEMSRCWLDMKRHIPALLDTVRRSSGDPHGELRVSWLTTSSFLDDYNECIRDTRYVQLQHFTNLDIDGLFDSRQENRITLDAAFRAIQLLSTTQYSSSFHLVIVAANEPSCSLDSQAWKDVASTLTSHGVYCHLALNANSTLNTFTTLFNETMRQQGNVEEPRSFGSESSNSILLRLSATRQLVAQSHVQCFPEVQQGMNHSTDSRQYEMFASEDAFPFRPPPFPRSNTYPQATSELYPNNTQIEYAHQTSVDNGYPPRTCYPEDAGLVGELVPDVPNGYYRAMANECVNSSFPDEYPPSPATSFTSNGVPYPTNEHTYTPSYPSPAATTHYAPSSSSSSSDASSPSNLVEQFQQHFDVVSRTAGRNEHASFFLETQPLGGEPEPPRQRARTTPNLRRPADLSPLITTPPSKSSRRPRGGGKDSLVGSSPKKSASSPRGRHPPPLLRTTRRGQASVPASPLDRSPLTPQFDTSVRSDMDGYTSAVASSPITPYADEMSYACLPPSSSPLTPLCSGAAFCSPSDPAWQAEPTRLSSSFTVASIQTRNQYPIAMVDSSSSSTTTLSRQSSPTRLLPPPVLDPKRTLFALNLGPSKLSSLSKEDAGLKERSGYNKIEALLPDVATHLKDPIMGSGNTKLEASVPELGSTVLPMTSAVIYPASGGYHTIPHTHSIATTSFSPRASEYPVNAAAILSYEQQRQQRSRSNSSSLTGWAG